MILVDLESPNAYPLSGVDEEEEEEELTSDGWLSGEVGEGTTAIGWPM